MLYGTTLAISLVGSVAALRPGGIDLQFTGIEEALGLAGSAAAATPASFAPPASVSAKVRTNRSASTAPAGLVALLPDKPAIVPERGSAAPQIRPAVAQHMTRLEVAKPVPSLGLEQAMQAAPPTASAPEAIAVQEPQPDQSTAVPTDKVAQVPSGPSFNETFQAVPPPSLATVVEPVPVLPSAETGTAPKASADLVAPGPVPTLSAAPAAAAFAQPSVASPQELVAPLAALPVAVPQPESAAPALAAQGELVSKPAPASAATRPAEPAVQVSAAAPMPVAQPLRLVSSPQLRKFDLARIHVVPPAPPASLAPSRAKPDRLGTVRHAGAKDRLVEGTVFHRVTVAVAGSALKTLELKIGADMKPSIKVGDLLGLVSDRMDPASVARFASAASAQDYVSLADLRAAGFNVYYNAGADSISITAGE